MIDLTDKIAIVTGGASGIGKGICLVLAEQGATVVVADVDGKGAESVASELSDAGHQAMAVVLDVTGQASVDNTVSQVLEKFGQIDILVNDAGLVGAPNWWERGTPSDEDWDRAMAVNLRGMVRVSEAVGEHMKQRRYGKIVNIVSIAARQGLIDVPQYSSSKAAAANWTQSHALQLAPYDINVNAICPGMLWTPLYDRMVQRRVEFGFNPDLRGLSGREYFDKLVEKMTPMKREQTPEDVGRLAAFLASDDARNITGQAINLDGGRRMN